MIKKTNPFIQLIGKDFPKYTWTLKMTPTKVLKTATDPQMLILEVWDEWELIYSYYIKLVQENVEAVSICIFINFISFL